MENVAPIPDSSLTVNGEKHIRSTYAHLGGILDGWAANMGNFPAGTKRPPTLSGVLIRRWWLTQWMEALYGGLGKVQSTVSWVRRISTIRSHWRQTFRISRKWTNRMLTLRAHRISVLDPTTGTYAPSVAYGDYLVIPTEKAYASKVTDQHFFLLHPSNLTRNGSLEGVEVSPARVSIVDEHQGIVRLDYSINKTGLQQSIVPGLVQKNPSFQQRGGNHPTTYDASIRQGDNALSLKSGHKVAVILTATPSAPNNINRLHRVSVRPEEAKEYLATNNIENAGLDRCNGAAWNVRVFPSMTTARFGWVHTEAEKIKKSFGYKMPDGEVNSFNPNSVRDEAFVEKCMLNPEQVKVFARVMAASIYSRFTDKPSGGKAGVLVTGIRPNVGSVIYQCDTGGVVSTIVDSEAYGVPVDALALLPMNQRQGIQHLLRTPPASDE